MSISATRKRITAMDQNTSPGAWGRLLARRISESESIEHFYQEQLRSGEDLLGRIEEALILQAESRFANPKLSEPRRAEVFGLQVDFDRRKHVLLWMNENLPLKWDLFCSELEVLNLSLELMMRDGLDTADPDILQWVGKLGRWTEVAGTFRTAARLVGEHWFDGQDVLTKGCRGRIHAAVARWRDLVVKAKSCLGPAFQDRLDSLKLEQDKLGQELADAWEERAETGASLMVAQWMGDSRRWSNLRNEIIQGACSGRSGD